MPSMIFSVVTTLVPFEGIIASSSSTVSELRAGAGWDPPMPETAPGGDGGAACFATEMATLSV